MVFELFRHCMYAKCMIPHYFTVELLERKAIILLFCWSNTSEHSILLASIFPQAPNYPNPGRCWNIVDKYKVSIFYTAPTLVRSLIREGDEVSMPIHTISSLGLFMSLVLWKYFCCM